jgi:hypothetical protein
VDKRRTGTKEQNKVKKEQNQEQEKQDQEQDLSGTVLSTVSTVS